MIIDSVIAFSIAVIIFVNTKVTMNVIKVMISCCSLLAIMITPTAVTTKQTIKL